jgi:diacylglycerol kinase family enzyme
LPVVVLINRSSLDNATAPQPQEILSAMAAQGVAAEVCLSAGAELTLDARRCLRREPKAVVAAGGDGTVSAVAGILAGTGIPLGVIPLGTLNHFAGDLGIPNALAEAAAIIASGQVRRVDVGEVNGHIFVNNSSIGFYPLAVRQREALQGRLGKWPAMTLSLLYMLWRLPRMHLHVRLAEGSLPRRTPLIFIGNNRYEMQRFAAPRRITLDGGELCLLLAPDAPRRRLVRIAATALLGTLDPERDLEALCCSRLQVEAHHHLLSVALDGEVVRLVPPLHYQIRAAALHVLAPSAGT